LKKIYIFSGLGVDRRVFDNIDFSYANVHFVAWIKPYQNEQLNSYAQRISTIITEENPILIGLSFGGILCIEISKFIKVDKIILIASAKTRLELPLIYRLIGKLNINKIVPSNLLKKQNVFTYWMFGLELEADQKLFKTIINESDADFLSWAINEIINWRNMCYPSNVIHIHGTKDRIIPIKNVKVDFVIQNGGHFITVNRARQVEAILKKALNF
jgi:esterase/lipase